MALFSRVLAILLALLMQPSAAHSYYPGGSYAQPAAGNKIPAPTPAPECASDTDLVPVAVAWHAHILFKGREDYSVAEAYKLRDAFNKTFGVTTDCINDLNSTHYDPSNLEMCIYGGFKNNGGIYGACDGVWVTANFAYNFPAKNAPLLLDAMNWLNKRRGSLDVFWHPVTGCETRDHLYSAGWVGQTWPLLTKVLEPPYACNYAGCVNNFVNFYTDCRYCSDFPGGCSTQQLV